MAKLNELSELLVQELDQFATSLDKLESMNKKGINVDLSKLQHILEGHREQVERSQKQLEWKSERLEHIVKESNRYPRWAVVIFLTSIGVNVLLLLLFVVLHYN